MCPFRFIIWVFVLKVFMAQVSSKFEFTNVKCISLDEKFIEFDYCYLKSINRTYKYGSAKFRLHKTPIKNFVLNMALMKRFNGYKPFLYNITYDLCKLLINPKSLPIAKYFFDFVKPFSNMNHSCPYEHDLIFDKVPIEYFNYRLTKILPFPEGDYLFETTWLVKGIGKGVTKIYGTLS